MYEYTGQFFKFSNLKQNKTESWRLSDADTSVIIWCISDKIPQSKQERVKSW